MIQKEYDSYLSIGDVQANGFTVKAGFSPITCSYYEVENFDFEKHSNAIIECECAYALNRTNKYDCSFDENGYTYSFVGQVLSCSYADDAYNVKIQTFSQVASYYNNEPQPEPEPEYNYAFIDPIANEEYGEDWDFNEGPYNVTSISITNGETENSQPVLIPDADVLAYTTVAPYEVEPNRNLIFYIGEDENHKPTIFENSPYTGQVKATYDDGTNQCEVIFNVESAQIEVTVAFTSPVNGANYVEELNPEDDEYNGTYELDITLQYSNGDNVNLDNVLNNTTLTDTDDNGLSIASEAEDLGQGYEETSRVFVSIPENTSGSATLTYDDGEHDPASVTFTYDITVATPDEPDEPSQYAPSVQIDADVTSAPNNGEFYVVGETISCNIVITNIGDCALSGIVVTEPKSQLNTSIASLDINDTSSTITIQYTVQAADLANGEVELNVTVTANTPDSTFTDTQNATIEPVGSDE